MICLKYKVGPAEIPPRKDGKLHMISCVQVNDVVVEKDSGVCDAFYVYLLPRVPQNIRRPFVVPFVRV